MVSLFSLTSGIVADTSPWVQCGRDRTTPSTLTTTVSSAYLMLLSIFTHLMDGAVSQRSAWCELCELVEDTWAPSGSLLHVRSGPEIKIVTAAMT